MSIHVVLRHATRYRFDRLVGLSAHTVRLRPAPHCRTPIPAYSLHIEPRDHFINWQQDPFGNYLARLVFPEKARELVVDVEVIADMTPINPFDFFIEEEASEFPFQYDPELAQELLPYLKCDPLGPLLDNWLGRWRHEKGRTIDFIVALNQQLRDDVDYSVRMEPGVQTPEQTLELKVGSCRDSGWLLVQALRQLGLAARFASGYLVQLTPDVPALDGPQGPSADFTDLHAWAEVFLPGAGWVGLDPTSGLLASEGHIPLACTPTPGSAAPISGFTDECEVEFEFSNSVQRLREDPRVTRPFTEHQWSLMDALGSQIDADLNAQDVRLTMGGEPTFVSIDDMDSAQWNTDADGAHKRELAENLFLRLNEEFAPHGLSMHMQGKWYPGEPLPRWNKSRYWRVDGIALWRDQTLLARADTDLGHTVEDAHRFASRLARALGFNNSQAQPAFEDPLQSLQLEAELPVNLDIAKLDSVDLKDSDERQRLVRIMDHGLGSPVGYVLPLERNVSDTAWISSNWPLRRGKIVLIAGDSPMGMRLPLESLPYESEPPLPAQTPDPFAARSPLPGPATIRGQTAAAPKSESGELSPTVIRTALCIEARGGLLHIFLPPISNLEAFAALVYTLETIAAELQLPLVLEGYPPPTDHRVKQFSVTPDPGVIEVNIHPNSSWKDLVSTTSRLYEIARECRLGTEKFMLDGRHTGTGGGNHLVLGGAAPEDSPFLRRPDLLRSLLTFWQAHPSLSYLFSGMFVGPTSQAPRVDEGRDDRLYELEIAFEQLPSGESEQPWLVDRVLRNLLTDLTGNTHRSEFCIDKLYSPDSATGRRGLLELRAFEMPPSAKMSLAQQLLVRALVAMFWRQPIHRRLMHWGTTLQDRFMLPYYVWEDFAQVIDDLNNAGYAFNREWFDAFLEFRFPRYGEINMQGIEFELRAAIEPWHVLGEESTQGGTARFVDSSVERVQVLARGARDERYVLACNGRVVPLSPTGRNEEYVAGIRFQAWRPFSSLHPTIAPQSPLVFDLIDTWNGRSVGGFTYHVSHAGGLSYETLPVNELEAGARRVSRFAGMGHTLGPIQLAPEHRKLDRFSEGGSVSPTLPPLEEANPRFPHTLDLRRPRRSLSS